VGAQQALKESRTEAMPATPRAVPGAEQAWPRLGVHNLTLSYGRRVVLDDVSLAVAPGEVVGLLGPNGSGKTSLLRCLTGLMPAQRGLIRLDGRAVAAGARTLRSCMGVVFQEPSLDIKLTAFDNLLLGAALFGIRGAEARQRAQELLVFMDLEARSREPVQRLSGGMRRRLEVARALIHRPALLLLDEPTTGLDPLALDRTWQRLLALRRAQGLTMLLSTHHAEEAARCDRVVVLDRGHVVATDTPDGLLARVAGDVIVMEAEKPDALVQELHRELGVTAILQGEQVLLERESGHTWVPRIVEALGARRLQAISVRRPSLADAFYHLTGRGLLPPAGA
jgi:ABC-2 type transport system ATP-binding protein